MERWQNKIAVVTGASAGIGLGIAKALVEKGMIVVGLARRFEKMESYVRPPIGKASQMNFHTFKCDVSDEQSVKDAFAWIEQHFGGIDVLINNAGIMIPTTLTAPDNSKIMKNTVNTNILGVVWCTREAFRSMKQRNFAGHVVNISSVVGHAVPSTSTFAFNIYPATKHAVKALTESLRLEFLTMNTKIKVTSISPGVVKTDILGESPQVYNEIPTLAIEDVVEAVIYCLQTPPHVQIHDIIMLPIGEHL